MTSPTFSPPGNCHRCGGLIDTVWEESADGWTKRGKCMNCGRYPGSPPVVEPDPEIGRTRKRLAEMVYETGKETDKEGEMTKENAPTLRDLADILGVSPQTMANWRAKGIPPAKREEVSRKLAMSNWSTEVIDRKAPTPPDESLSLDGEPTVKVAVPNCEKKVTESSARFRVVFHGSDPARIVRVLFDHGFELYGMERI